LAGESTRGAKKYKKNRSDNKNRGKKKDCCWEKGEKGVFPNVRKKQITKKRKKEVFLPNLIDFIKEHTHKEWCKTGRKNGVASKEGKTWRTTWKQKKALP